MKMFLLFLFSIQVSHAADSCEVFKWIGTQQLNERKEFWEEYAKLAQTGPVDNQQMLELVAKYTGKDPAVLAAQISGKVTDAPVPPATAVVSLVNKYRMKIPKDIDKKISAAPKAVQEKFDQILQLLQEKGPSAYSDLRNGGFQLQKHRSTGGFEVRLNQDWRLIFNENHGNFSVLGVGKDLTH